MLFHIKFIVSTFHLANAGYFPNRLHIIVIALILKSDLCRTEKFKFFIDFSLCKQHILSVQLLELDFLGIFLSFHESRRLA